MYKDLSLKEKAKVIREGVRLGLNSINDILSLYDKAISSPEDPPVILKANKSKARFNKYDIGGFTDEPDNPPVNNVPQTLPEVEIVATKSYAKASPYKEYLNNPKLLKKDFLSGLILYYGPLSREYIQAKKYNWFDNKYYTDEVKNELSNMLEATGFFNAYLNSPAYKQRYENAGLSSDQMKYTFPELRVVADNNDYGAFSGKRGIEIPILYGLEDDLDSNDLDIIHEMAHSNPLFNTKKENWWWDWAFNRPAPEDSPKYRNDYSNVPDRWKELLSTLKSVGFLTPDKDFYPNNKHDKELAESYSDLQAVRYLLYKNGIWNPMLTDKPFGEEEYQKLRELIPTDEMLMRFMGFHTKDLIINAINEVAQNIENNEDNTHYAKKGGHLKQSHIMAYGSPDWDPEHPYHYHTKTGEKVVITPEDWEKHKGLPYFKLVENAVLAELAVHPGPEYKISPQFSLALRQVYKGNMGPKYQNYSSFSGNLPGGYSFTPEGLVSDNQGNLYVLKGFRLTPRFTYDESKPLILQVLEGNNKGNVTFYPVNMEKTVKPALPVSSTMNVNKERDKAISEYIKDNTTHSTVNETMYKEPYFYPDIDAVDYDWEEWKKEHPVQELRRAVTKDYLYDLIKLKALNHFIFADEEGLEYDPFWSEDEDWVNDSYMQEEFDEKFNSYINKPINLIKLKSNITKKPTYAKAKQKAVIEVGPLLIDDVLTYAQGGPIVSPYGQWLFNGKKKKEDTIVPSNNITMDNVNYPVLGISDTGDTKIMMPWNDYKFRGSVVYEHPLIGNQFQLGGNTKPTFDLWYPTIPNQKNDTSSYDLRRAYNMLPFDEMEKFRTIDDYHLPSVAYDENTDTYTFLKRNGHPTLNYELDWYNSGSPDALEFRERYKLDTLSLPWRYVPRTFLTGGLAKKPEPIYNENGQVIGRRYVNKDNPKITDSVVPQGRVNFQEFLKAKGKKARATNFEDLELFLDSLIARGYNEPLRLAFLATSYNEMDNKGAASRGIGGNGYMGFNTIRMPLNLLNDSSKLIQYILDDTEKLTPDNWTDGGSGGPYIKNLIDAFNKFWNETNPNTATLVLNKTNIRPAKLSDWYLRASDADLMKQYMEYPELPKEEEQKQKKSNKLLDSFVDFILSGGLLNTPSYAGGGNLFKKGGIYIKPENRGKFTALKKRTGHSASWFKAHGTPAQKKMATFALNAKKWHHKDEGGYLYSEGGFLLAPYLYNE